MSLGYAKKNDLVEVRVPAGEVVIGSIIAGRTKADAWEIVDMAHGDQIEDLHTLWWKAVNLSTGEIVAIPPRSKTALLTVLRESEDAEPETSDARPSDADAIMLLVEKLGASIIARKDNETGEVTCPSYETHKGWTDLGHRAEYDLHLRLAHNIDVAALDPEDVARRVELHGQAHNPRHPEIGKTGFPHRHVPEPRQNVYAYAGVAK